MRIENSSIMLNSRHTKIEQTTIKESLDIWGVKDNPVRTGKVDYLEISQELRKMLETFQKEPQPEALQQPQELLDDEISELNITPEDKLKISLLESFVKKLTGKTIKIQLPTLKLKNNRIQPENKQEQSVNQGNNKLSWGIRYNYQETHLEQERMCFSSLQLFQVSLHILSAAVRNPPFYQMDTR